MDIDQVKTKLIENEFTIEASATFIDFLIRHSLLTSDEEGYDAIFESIHCKLPFPAGFVDF
jgi:hypothetical protein